jgi:hypothetical protein
VASGYPQGCEIFIFKIHIPIESRSSPCFLSSSEYWLFRQRCFHSCQTLFHPSKQYIRSYSMFLLTLYTYKYQFWVRQGRRRLSEMIIQIISRTYSCFNSTMKLTLSSKVHDKYLI